MKQNTRTKYVKLTVVVLALLLANANLFLSSRAIATAQDVAGMDKSVDPGDDFFRFANGGWFKAAQIPADRPSYGTFDLIAEKVGARTADLIKRAGKSANDSDSLKICDYYDDFMD